MFPFEACFPAVDTADFAAVSVIIGFVAGASAKAEALKLARHVYPNAKSHRLESLLIDTGLRDKVADQLHRAADDAYATALLLDHLIEKSSASTWQEICKIAQLKTQPDEQSPPPEQGSLW